jgi:hypothetical protein
MNWYEATKKYHVQTFPHDCQLSSLPEPWQRELAAIWRLEADVNNGAYLQFLSNWGRESYVYASQGLKKMGAHKMAEIVDNCQALVDDQLNLKGASPWAIRNLMPNAMILFRRVVLRRSSSNLPNPVVQRIYELSHEFMDYPDDLEELGLKYYGHYLVDELPEA